MTKKVLLFCCDVENTKADTGGFFMEISMIS